MSEGDWFCPPSCGATRLPTAAVESGKHACSRDVGSCQTHAAASESLAQASPSGGSAPEASIDCFSPETGGYLCVARGGTTLARTALAWRGGGDHTSATSAVAPHSTKKDTSKAPGAPPPAAAPSPSNVKALEHRVAQLEQKQQASLLGLQAAADMQAGGAETSERLWTSLGSGWGSPFSAQVRFLGDGSALIARHQSTGARLLTTEDLSGAERIALAARSAPVVGALDWLQRGDPLGFYNSEEPLNAWSVGGELSRRFPSYVLEAEPHGQGSSSPTTVSEALFALEHALPQKGRPPTHTAHYCCRKEAPGDCDLVSVARGTAGCTEIRSIDSLGAAKAHCVRACGGAPEVSTCFDAETCELLSSEAARTRPCFADQLVCTTARAQQEALRDLGLTFA